MFNFLWKNKWKSSPVHLLLLSKFLRANSLSDYKNNDYWENELREHPPKAIERFIKEELIRPAELPALVDSKFNYSDLKSMLRKLNQKTSGRKAELIRRLIEHDKSTMLSTTNHLDLFQCTNEGVQLAESYLEASDMKRLEAERLCLSLLSTGEYMKACHAVAQYETSRPFPRGLGVDWDYFGSKKDILSLKLIFERTPGILKGMERNRLDQLRVSAGMMDLWGTNSAKRWLSEEYETGIHLKSDAAGRMLLFHANHIRNLEDYREAEFRKIQILGVNDGASCSECLKIDGKEYLLDQVPELPYAKCTCEFGCRCITLAAEFT